MMHSESFPEYLGFKHRKMEPLLEKANSETDFIMEICKDIKATL